MAKDVKVRLIDVRQIVENPDQPRLVFEEEALRELAASIQKHGVLQPITVRRRGGGRYELIAGERRLRAAQLAGLQEVPAILLDVSDEESAVLALIENIQRQDLSYMEEAQGYQKLTEAYGMTQEDIAEMMGKSQSAVANKMRLLKLSEAVQQALAEFGLTERHARALLKLSDEKLQLEAAIAIGKQGLNVREAEFYIDLIQSGLSTADAAEVEDEGKDVPRKKPHVKRYVRDIRLFTNTVSKAALYMQEAGVPVEVTENKTDAYYEMVVRVPYTNYGESK